MEHVQHVPKVHRDAKLLKALVHEQLRPRS